MIPFLYKLSNYSSNYYFKTNINFLLDVQTNYLQLKLILILSRYMFDDHYKNNSNYN